MIGLFIKWSDQTFELLTVIYKRGNFVYHHWGCASFYRPLSYPFRSLLTTGHCPIKTLLIISKHLDDSEENRKKSSSRLTQRQRQRGTGFEPPKKVEVFDNPLGNLIAFFKCFIYYA